MAKARKFKTHSGGHLSVYVPWQPAPIEIMEGETIETADPLVIEALESSPEVVEVKAGKK